VQRRRSATWKRLSTAQKPHNERNQRPAAGSGGGGGQDKKDDQDNKQTCSTYYAVFKNLRHQAGREYCVTGVLPGTIVTVCLRRWRCSASCVCGTRPGGCTPTIRRSRRCSPTEVIGPLRSRRRPPASEITAVGRTRARRATPGELRHWDHLAGHAFERWGNGPIVRIVESCIGVVVICLVGVEVWEWRDSVWVWVELRGGVGRGGGCVAKRIATNIVGIDARTARAVCRQGDVLVVCVKFGPFYLFVY
jgi:hypothetical protein